MHRFLFSIDPQIIATNRPRRKKGVDYELGYWQMFHINVWERDTIVMQINKNEKNVCALHSFFWSLLLWKLENFFPNKILFFKNQIS